VNCIPFGLPLPLAHWRIQAWADRAAAPIDRGVYPPNNHGAITPTSPFPLPSLFLPFVSFPSRSPPIRSQRSGPLETSYRWSGERCKLPQWGLGRRSTLVYSEREKTHWTAISIGCAKKVTSFWYPSFLPLLDALYLQFLFTYISFSLNAWYHSQMSSVQMDSPAGWCTITSTLRKTR